MFNNDSKKSIKFISKDFHSIIETNEALEFVNTINKFLANVLSRLELINEIAISDFIFYNFNDFSIIKYDNTTIKKRTLKIIFLGNWKESLKCVNIFEYVTFREYSRNTYIDVDKMGILNTILNNCTGYFNWIFSNNISVDCLNINEDNSTYKLLTLKKKIYNSYSSSLFKIFPNKKATSDYYSIYSYLASCFHILQIKIQITGSALYNHIKALTEVDNNMLKNFLEFRKLITLENEFEFDKFNKLINSLNKFIQEHYLKLEKFSIQRIYKLANTKTLINNNVGIKFSKEEKLTNQVIKLLPLKLRNHYNPNNNYFQNVYLFFITAFEYCRNNISNFLMFIESKNNLCLMLSRKELWMKEYFEYEIIDISRNRIIEMIDNVFQLLSKKIRNDSRFFDYFKHEIQQYDRYYCHKENSNSNYSN